MPPQSQLRVSCWQGCVEVSQCLTAETATGDLQFIIPSELLDLISSQQYKLALSWLVAQGVSEEVALYNPFAEVDNTEMWYKCSTTKIWKNLSKTRNCTDLHVSTVIKPPLCVVAKSVQADTMVCAC